MSRLFCSVLFNSHARHVSHAGGSASFITHRPQLFPQARHRKSTFIRVTATVGPGVGAVQVVRSDWGFVITVPVVFMMFSMSLSFEFTRDKKHHVSGTSASHRVDQRV